MKALKNVPNIVFVLTDDQGYGDLGCHGNPWLKTPNIDLFASSSARLTNYHVGPTCAPTRSGLLTGHYANSTGVWHTIGGRSLLRSDEWTLASALSENGYKTGIFGKWHLGDSFPFRPQDRGFSTTLIHGGGGIGQTPDYWGNDYFNDTYFADGQPEKFQGYCTDVFFSEAMKFIETNKDTPFFCYIPTNAPHSPYNVPDKYADMYRGQVKEDRARFYGMISNIDDNFGRLRRLLRQLELEENTILIFMTDNGSSEALTFNDRGDVVEGFNAGLRGLKGSEYDGGHRVPFFINWPMGDIKPGEINDLTANVDFMPTILDLCSIDSDDHSFHGISLKNLLISCEPPAKRIVVTDSQRVVHPIKWKQSCAMTGEWRLINGRELYNMENDRNQQRDLADQFPRLAEKLREGYEVWWKKVSVKFDQPISFDISRGCILTSHDWRGDEKNAVWNQGLVRKGQPSTGHWEIKSDASRKYKINLYRWPPETGYRLRQGIIGCDTDTDFSLVQDKFAYYYLDGQALQMISAQMSIDGRAAAKASVEKDDFYASFIVDIPKGEHTIEGLFQTEDSLELGAYYAEILPIVKGINRKETS